MEFSFREAEARVIFPTNLEQRTIPLNGSNPSPFAKRQGLMGLFLSFMLILAIKC